ncbi:GNAT family N-acetyltransferase [Barnesiella sp. An55]|uniref:GNAT family N-acetyltransferase n=1 Tax=Barnesiella sp. An55 TaxID=1965646 RepID=UPI000B384018|nr:GNAT family N-acetyltransferase [Barnesiella sp. An55]OUN71135.1 GNAT family N-acetyltransferase [Barnesiella sp. An55]HIZ26128.1 GNAT family N-acetyltransferase [Candidatus Barnesiella merdipullorum]
MIREVNPQTDAAAITGIYNEYILHSTISFETQPLTVEAMHDRIAHIANQYPYFVAEEGGVIVGYCYAHPWKERAAYGHTLETTVYLSPESQSRGIGKQLMLKLIGECRARGYRALIACITGNNEASRTFHERLGFSQVSLFKEVGYKLGQWLDVVDYELLLTAQTSLDRSESATLKF